MESKIQDCIEANIISFSPVNEKVPVMQALILPMHTSEDMLDRWIMKVYSPRVSSTTPLSSDMVMKAFLRRTRPSIRLSKERLRHVLNAYWVRPYVCQINSIGRSSMHKCPIQASHVSYPCIFAIQSIQSFRHNSQRKHAVQSFIGKFSHIAHRCIDQVNVWCKIPQRHITD